MSLTSIAKDAAGCTRCDLYQHATQTVFGEGPRDAAIVLIGEQPGDSEDKQGHPFVGPAGRVLDRALADSGLDRTGLYLTNAVKHFRHTDRGKRRIHERPDTTQIRACRPWLDDELRLIQPRLVVLLGAVAGEALFGTKYRVGAHKGEVVDAALGDWHGRAVGTIHPSAVLRGPDQAARDTAYAGLVEDLATARNAAAG
ncbi:MAG TPA: UdgX family uracil-DNA binding protein [Streptosporangiaceae bacterium]|nr:UdgX family uracil-DNA binding protein [Streptosporangiaceae bacterium]